MTFKHRLFLALLSLGTLLFFGSHASQQTGWQLKKTTFSRAQLKRFQFCEQAQVPGAKSKIQCAASISSSSGFGNCGAFTFDDLTKTCTKAQTFCSQSAFLNDNTTHEVMVNLECVGMLNNLKT
jgi:hypothetical protein